MRVVFLLDFRSFSYLNHQNLLDFLQQANFTLAGHSLYAQQFTNVLGALFLALLIFYLKVKVQKREQQLGQS